MSRMTFTTERPLVGSRTLPTRSWWLMTCRDARVVLQADLKPGSTGMTAARLSQEFTDLKGVAGTRGDAGQHVWVYSTPDATARGVSAALSAMYSNPSVARVEIVE